MSQVIAFTKRSDFKTLLEVECRSLTGFVPVVKDSVEDFVQMLGLFPTIEILVVDSPATKSDYQFLLRALSEKEPSVKTILMVSDERLPLKKCLTYPGSNIEGLIAKLKLILNPAGATQADFMAVPLDALVHFKTLPFDLYIKIAEGKLVRRFPAGEEIEDGVVAQFKAKGIRDLYFEKRFNRDFSVLLMNNMINKVEKSYASDDQRLRAKSEVFVTAREIVQSIGLPPKVVEVCESVMEKITEDVLKGKDKLANYLTQIQKKTDLSFQFRFVELSSFIATQIVEELNEPSKMEQIKKVVFAAFFCDVSLKEANYLNFRSEESVKDLWPEIQRAVRDHALKSSEIVAKYKDALPEVCTIIREHHGTPEGIGFPKVINHTILPLSKVLLASQELAIAMLNEPEVPAATVVKKVLEKFEASPIAGCLVAFENACKVKI